MVTQYLVSQAQLGKVSIRTEQPPLIVEVIDDEGQSIGEPVTLPSSKPITLKGRHAVHQLVLNARGQTTPPRDVTGRATYRSKPEGIVRTYTTRSGLPSDYAGQIVLDRGGLTELGAPQVGTVGRLEFQPNAINVVPEMARMSIER